MIHVSGRRFLSLMRDSAIVIVDVDLLFSSLDVTDSIAAFRGRLESSGLTCIYLTRFLHKNPHLSPTLLIT